MTKIKGLIIWLREAKYEVWDTLPPVTRNRIVGAFYAFEGAGYAAAVSAMVNWPTPSLKTIFTTSAVTGFIAVRNYLKQPNRIPLGESNFPGPQIPPSEPNTKP